MSKVRTMPLRLKILQGIDHIKGTVMKEFMLLIYNEIDHQAAWSAE